MFDYKISKHPHFDEACRAFALCHNMAKLADRAGINVQTLRNQLNAEQPHQLTAPEIWLLTDIQWVSELTDELMAKIRNHGYSRTMDFSQNTSEDLALSAY